VASLKLKIAGMHCSHCQTKVEQALKAVAGTMGAAVFLDDGEAEIEFDAGRASVEQYLDAVRRVGYLPSLTE
jgi:copper chaperone CopZ